MTMFKCPRCNGRLPEGLYCVDCGYVPPMKEGIDGFIKALNKIASNEDKQEVDYRKEWNRFWHSNDTKEHT